MIRDTLFGIIGLILGYFIVSFYHWEFNPSHISEVSRMMIMLASALFCLVMVGISKSMRNIDRELRNGLPSQYDQI